MYLCHNLLNFPTWLLEYSNTEKTSFPARTSEDKCNAGQCCIAPETRQISMVAINLEHSIAPSVLNVSRVADESPKCPHSYPHDDVCI